MCPTAAASTSEPTVPTTEGAVGSDYVEADTHAQSAPERAAKAPPSTGNPYGTRYADFLSNVSKVYASQGMEADFTLLTGFFIVLSG